MERDQPSPTAGEFRKTQSNTPQRVSSTTTGPGHAQRQVTVIDKEGDLALSKISESREQTNDSLIKALRRMGITALKISIQNWTKTLKRGSNVPSSI